MKTRDHFKYAERCGVEFSRVSDSECVGTALFSEKPNKFYLNRQNGLWSEKQLGIDGNDTTLASMSYQWMRDNTTDDDLALIADWRGLSPQAFRWWGIACFNGNVIDPVHSLQGNVTEIRTCAMQGKKRFWIGSPGVPLDVGGWHRFAKASVSTPVYLCEGTWDACALNWVWRSVGINAVVLSLPGASAFKAAWAQRLTGRKVVVCFDDDDAGRKGTDRAVDVLGQYGINASVLNWKSIMGEVNP